MKLSHHQLEAFYTCSQTLNMSEAALRLHVTQSALSQRLSLLESELEITLFIRDPKGLILTPEGERLLRHSERVKALEEEVLLDLKGKTLGGTVRFGGYSSVMRSIIIPKLTPFLRKHPELNLDFQTHEIKSLPATLDTSRTDFIVLDYSMKKKSIEEHLLFTEVYAVVESANHKSPSDVYLDHNADDLATQDFFEQQDKDPSYRRNFLGDIYGVIQGVEEGLGRAVMSKHLIQNNKKIKVVKGFKTVEKPVILHYYKRPYYTELQKRILSNLGVSYID